MKKYKLIVLFSVILVTFNSCSDFLDVNTDPNNPDTAPAKMTLSAAEMSTAAFYNNYLMIYGSIWAEHLSQNFTSNQYNAINDYNPQPTDFNWMWSESFSGALNDYKKVLEVAEADEDWNMYLIATCMQTFHFAILADLFDKIPYSEGLQGNTGILAPKYDDGDAVYADLLTRINAALSKDFSAITNTQVGANDYVFHGDMNRWKAFANTLKLKMYLRQTKVGSVNAQLTECLNSSYGFVSEALIGGFTAEPGKRNPFYGVNMAGEGLGTDNFRAADVLLDYLKNNNDIRYDGIFKSGPGAPGAFNSMLFGDRLNPGGSTESDKIARGNWKTDDPVYFFTKAMVEFMIAEAKERTGSSGQDNYEAGIIASFIDFGHSSADANALLDGTYAYPSDANGKIKAIITQKWIASAIRLPIEAWLDYNRTGYPDFLKPSANSQIGGGLTPKRFFWPASETSRNTYAPKQEAIETPVWWAK
ncbi:MAG: SusD/RagB family nutrient-binding outer membrane lipoprotein [Dysgonamonadaceae bacterium]|jgi:hypothetical protein|nr:SusD/RagB family nutrient-binding outer membrane lipoprotein [Dysgonamonadaceae bacterium]